MNHRIVENNGTAYLEGIPGSTNIASDRDILDFIVHCGDCDSNRILLYEENLTEDFFDLKTGLAGAILQKLAVYSVMAAVVVSESRVTERFGELVGESQKSRTMRFFTDTDKAVAWIGGTVMNNR